VENSPSPIGSPIDAAAALASDLRGAIQTVIEGKTEAIDMAVVVLLAGGHLLIEDAPGVGKTMLARTLARTIDCSARRIQFTADLLPSDITGVSIFNPDTRGFEFKPGGVFANVVISDEINRASPKTQSALLEAMEEGRVSVDGTTHRLPQPFMVVATQNPIEMQGTYPLPEAQRDRFTACIEMGYPTRAAELDMLEHHVSADPLASVRTVTDGPGVLAAMSAVRTVFLHEALKEYIVTILERTRDTTQIMLGASPRAGLHLARAAKARAATLGRGYVIPEDISNLAVPVLAHRLLLAHRRSDRHATSEIVAEIVAGIQAPRRV
jgi:MoxR-like ATPase